MKSHPTRESIKKSCGVLVDSACVWVKSECRLPRRMTPFGTYIVETLVMLVVVVALTILVLVAARRFGFGRPLGPLEVVGRLPLEARRAVYLVRIVDRVYVLGASEAGIEKLGELDSETLEPALRSKATFGDVITQMLARKRTQTAEQGPKGGHDGGEKI
jgi:flagellar biogenesis protein FliO